MAEPLPELPISETVEQPPPADPAATTDQDKGTAFDPSAPTLAPQTRLQTTPPRASVDPSLPRVPEPIRARAMLGWERALKWVKRRPAAAAVYGLAVAVVGLVAMVMVVEIIDERLAWLWPDAETAPYIDYQAVVNDRLGKDIAPEKNANVLIWKALGPKPENAVMPAEFFKWLRIEEPPEDGDYFVGLFSYVKDHFKLDQDAFAAIGDELGRASQRSWAAKDYPPIAAWLKANEKPLALIVEATRRPDYFNPLVSHRSEKDPGSLMGALVPSVQKCRELAGAMSARAMLRVGEGKFDEAWQDLLACHRLGRLVAKGGTIIESLVGIAIDQTASRADLAYLERAKLTSGQIRDRLKDLQSLPPLRPIADQVDLLERLTYLDQLQLIRRDGIGALESLSGGGKAKPPDARERRALAKIDWEAAQQAGNRWFDKLAAALRLKDRSDQQKALDKIEQELKALKATGIESLGKFIHGDKMAGKGIGDVLIVLLMPAFFKVQNAHDRCEQVQRNLHVAFALAIYYRDKERYPAKLDDLAPEYLAAVPDDIFSGKALFFRPAEKGYLLYSVGVNGKDEGGRSSDDDPAGDDLPVLMPLPELQRKE